MQPGPLGLAAHLDHLQVAELPQADEPIMHTQEHVGRRRLGIERGVPRLGLTGDDSSRAQQIQDAAHGVEEAARRLLLRARLGPAHPAKAVEDDQAVAAPAHQRADLLRGGVKALRQELRQREHLELVAHQRLVEEAQRAQVAEQLGGRLGKGRQDEGGAARADGGDGHLGGQGGLARAGGADDEGEGAARQPAAEHGVEPGHAGRVEPGRPAQPDCVLHASSCAAAGRGRRSRCF